MDIKDSQNIFIGLDGGASKTKGVLFDIEGVTLSTSIDKGTNHKKLSFLMFGSLGSNSTIHSQRCHF